MLLEKQSQKKENPRNPMKFEKIKKRNSYKDIKKKIKVKDYFI